MKCLCSARLFPPPVFAVSSQTLGVGTTGERGYKLVVQAWLRCTCEPKIIAAQKWIPTTFTGPDVHVPSPLSLCTASLAQSARPPSVLSIALESCTLVTLRGQTHTHTHATSSFIHPLWLPTRLPTNFLQDLRLPTHFLLVPYPSLSWNETPY